MVLPSRSTIAMSEIMFGCVTTLCYSHALHLNAVADWRTLSTRNAEPPYSTYNCKTEKNTKLMKGHNGGREFCSILFSMYCTFIIVFWRPETNSTYNISIGWGNTSWQSADVFAVCFGATLFAPVFATQGDKTECLYIMFSTTSASWYQFGVSWPLDSVLLTLPQTYLTQLWICVKLQGNHRNMPSSNFCQYKRNSVIEICTMGTLQTSDCQFDILSMSVYVLVNK